MSEPIGTVQLSRRAKQDSPLDNSNQGNQGTLHIAGGQSCILTYHEVLRADSKYLYRVTSSAFENHLYFVSSVGKNASAGTAPKITFDDGHYSNYENAFPLLEQFGLKAIFFVLAGCIGSNRNYLSWEQAREIALAGHRIASHGWSHRIFTQCSSSELDQEIAQSKREIEDRLGVEIDSISAPGGRWDERVADACMDAGYKYLFHSNPWGGASFRKDIRLRGRHMVTRRMDSQQLCKIMQTTGMKRQYLHARYAAKERVRVMLGDRLYHRLWCWVANWSPGEGMELEVDGRENPDDESKAL